MPNHFWQEKTLLGRLLRNWRSGRGQSSDDLKVLDILKRMVPSSARYYMRESGRGRLETITEPDSRRQHDQS